MSIEGKEVRSSKAGGMDLSLLADKAPVITLKEFILECSERRIMIGGELHGNYLWFVVIFPNVYFLEQ